MTSDFELHVRRIGGMFDHDRDRWPETPQLWMNEENGIDVVMFVNNPHPEEIASIQSGTARFAWTEQGLNGFLLFRYGAMPWSDAAYNPQRLTEPFDLQPYERGTHRRVMSYLVNARDGRIAAMRVFTWPAYFYNHVVNSVRHLETLPYGEPEARADQASFYQRYPSPKALGQLAKSLPMEARCQGGQREDRPFL